MERVFSGDEMSDSFCAAAAGLPSPAAGGRPRGLMNRSPSEWYFEKFLEVAEEEAAIPRTTPPSPANPNLDPDYNRNPPPASAVASNSSGGGRKDGGRGEDDELVEIKEPAVVAAAAPPQGPPSDPPADVDPKEHAALLKQRLDLYCAAVATCRGSGVNSPDSSSLDSKSLSLDASQLGSQGPVQGFSEKMVSTRVRVLLYYDGMIQNDKTGVRYSHPANRMIRVFSSLSRQELLDHLYSCIPVDKEKYKIKLKWKSPNLSGRLMQSNYILVPIDDDEDVEEMLTFPLKYSECRFLELYIEKEDVPSFGYYSPFLTQADNNVGPSSSFVTVMVQTDNVEAVFAEQHSTTAGPSPIIQSPMVTSPMSSATVTSPLLEVVVSAGDDTHIGNVDWIVGGINSDNLDFESDESEDEDYWMDEDSSTNDDDGEDENDDEDVQTNINVGETK